MPSFPGGVGLTLALPLEGKRPVLPEWAFSLCNLHPPMNYEVRWAIVKGKPVAEARTYLAEQAIINRSKYIFFIGDDVTTPANTLRNLIFHMEHNPKIGVVGGIYCHKASPNAPLVFRGNGIGPYWDWKVGELFQVSGIGMDATLVRTDIFYQMQKPWFKTVDSIEPMLDAVNKAENWTEDLYFCKKVEELGYEVWADGSLLCGHWDWQDGGKCYSLPLNSLPMRQAGIKKGDKKIVDLGCGAPHESYNTPEGEVLRVDIRDECRPDYRCDLRKLPFATGQFDIVFSSHTLEHFPTCEIQDIIQEWIRILKEDGEMRLVLPNLEWAAQHIMNKEIDANVMNVLYGAQTYKENFHMTGFTSNIIEQLLAKFGFKQFVWDFHDYHMFVRAWRVPQTNLGSEQNPNVFMKKNAKDPDVIVKTVKAEDIPLVPTVTEQPPKEDLPEDVLDSRVVCHVCFDKLLVGQVAVPLVPEDGSTQKVCGICKCVPLDGILVKVLEA